MVHSFPFEDLICIFTLLLFLGIDLSDLVRANLKDVDREVQRLLGDPLEESNSTGAI
jgi:hypothetical protein